MPEHKAPTRSQRLNRYSACDSSVDQTEARSSHMRLIPAATHLSSEKQARGPGAKSAGFADLLA